MSIYSVFCQGTGHDCIQGVLTQETGYDSIQNEELVDTPMAHTWQKQEFVCVCVCVCVQSVVSCSN